jgi:hypothetical protein
MTTDEPDQEVWITLRLKASMPISMDAHKAAGILVKRIEAYLLHDPTDQKYSLWHRLFNRSVSNCNFTLCQPAELIEVEEEVEIYDTDETVL